MERKNASLGGSGEKAALKRDYFIHEEVSARRRKGILVRVLLVLVKTPPVASFLSPSLSPYPRDLLPSIILPQPFYFFPPLSLPPPLLLSLSLSLHVKTNRLSVHRPSQQQRAIRTHAASERSKDGKERQEAAFDGLRRLRRLLLSLTSDPFSLPCRAVLLFFLSQWQKKLPFPLSRLPCLFAFARRPNKA